MDSTLEKSDLTPYKSYEEAETLAEAESLFTGISEEKSKPSLGVSRTSWDEGIIAKLERFLMERYPIPQLWARGIGIAVTSAALHNLCQFEDKMGRVRPNIYVLYIAPSGRGHKTPPIIRAREIIREFDKGLLVPPRFTVEGLTEHITERAKEA